MIDTILEDDLLYYISKGDLQIEAQRRIGKKLKDNKFNTIRKFLDSSISINLDIIYNVIFKEEIEK